MHPNTLTNTMMKRVQAYRDGAITTSKLQEMNERDVQGFLQLKNNKLIDEQTFQSLLAIIYDFEIIIEEIQDEQTKVSD